MTGYYQRNHLQDSGSDDSEDRERLERCEATAMRYFRSATKEALRIRTQTIVDLQPYYGSPKYTRLRDAAERKYSAVSEPAWALYGRTVEELMRDGEVSEALSREWDQLKDAPRTGQDKIDWQRDHERELRKESV